MNGYNENDKRIIGIVINIRIISGWMNDCSVVNYIMEIMMVIKVLIVSRWKDVFSVV